MNIISLSAFAPENLVSRDGFGSPVPRQSAHLHTLRLNLVLTYGIPPGFRGGIHLFILNRHITPSGQVPSLSGHVIAYRWRSLQRVRQHNRARKPQGSSERMLPWQVIMDQLICVSLSHTHYWYEVVGMLKVPSTGALPYIYIYFFFTVQQTTSGIGHRVKYFFGLATNTLNVRNK